MCVCLCVSVCVCVCADASMDIAQFDGSKLDQLPAEVKSRMKRFGGERTPVFYGADLQNAHHIHFMNGPSTRLLQHHYGINAADSDANARCN